MRAASVVTVLALALGATPFAGEAVNFRVGAYKSFSPSVARPTVGVSVDLPLSRLQECL